jgi:hypothetical protein
MIILPRPLKLRGAEGKPDIEAYRNHWVDNLVKTSPHVVWDGSEICFLEDQFDHCFTKEKYHTKEKTRIFDRHRLEKMDWILPILKEASFSRYCDDRKAKPDGTGCRCQVLYDDGPHFAYCIVVEPNKNKMILITTMCVSKKRPNGGKSPYEKIIQNPLWK